MKITVSFLNKKMVVVKNIIEEVFSILTIFILFFSATLFILNTFKGSDLNKLIYFATNIRQAEEISFNLSDFAQIYPVYNPKNYSIEEKNVGVTNQEVTLNEEEKVYLKKLESIDNFAKQNLSAVEVFLKSSEYSANIYQNTDDVQKISVQDTKILNYSTMKNIDFNEISKKVINLTKKSDSILIYHTHTSETFTSDTNYPIEYTGTYRTTNAKYNMLRVGSEFEKNLNLKGFNVYQETTPHDYGTYTSAYSKSRITVINSLKKLTEKSNVGVSIDLHRDAMSDLTFRPTIEIDGIKVAQCMLVIGVGSDTNRNDFWFDNLALALKLQLIADKYYPGLFRPMIIRNSVYNQDLNKYSILVEVGSTGNTLEEVLFSTRCLTNILNIVYKE